MKLNDKNIVTIGDDGEIEFREPTNSEWNNFCSGRYPVQRGNKVKDNSNQARVDLFNLLVVRIDNVEDGAGTITVETKERLPIRIKTAAIFEAFESSEVEAKN